MEMMEIDDIVENTVLSSVSVFGSGLYNSDARTLFARVSCLTLEAAEPAELPTAYHPPTPINGHQGRKEK